MKNIYKILLSGFFLLIVGYSGVYGQTATTTVYFSGFQACGGCTVCGSDYWCTNTPGSYCGDTPPCKTLSFTDPVPAGHVVTSVTANYYTGSCEGASFTSSINGFSLPIAYDGATGCWCDDLPCMMTTSVTGNFPCGLPGYIYGGSNSFNLCSSGPMCINRAELIFTYVDPDVITPSITASGPLSFCMPGSVTLDAGTGYSAYHWNTGSTSQTIVATTAGVYTVTVTSTTGCTSGSSSVTVTAAPNVTPTFTQLGPYCKGQIPGVLPTTSLNGITGTWSPSTINTNNFGTTVHTFTPNAGQCAITTTMTVVVSPNTTPTFTQLGPYCAGQTPGTLPTTSTNSVAGTWSPATVNTSTPGTFTHTFTPNSGQCAEIVTMDIVVYANPTANATIHGNPSCNGSSDGSIVLNVSGGTSPYTFSWSNGASSQDLFDIPAGTYSVLVTDAHGCTASSSASLVEPNPIVASVGSVTPSICNTPGSATVSATGGTPPYTFTWPASAGGYVGPTHSSLSSGTYVVTASDQYGCSSSATVTVPQTGSVSASVGSITNVSCYGANNGSVQVNITAGTPDFTISWGSGSISTNLTSYTFTNLPAGTFGLTITDANGCVTSLSGITISEPQALVVQLNSITHVTCNGGSNGSASIGVTGGTPPYSYAWTPSTLSGANPTGLSAGNYSVTVSDAHNCTGTISFTIQETSDFVIVKDRENAPC
ncbi:MAG TPA: SprB repeat-containing protein, partial [Bacteroidales bacterium]|nr:SprB repeat-containing protein [Bacteroidales bacterium]